MATLDDSVLDSLRELNTLRDRAKELRQRGRKALADIPEKIDYENLVSHFDLAKRPDNAPAEWVSGPHPIDVALLVRVLSHRDLGSDDVNCPDKLYDVLAEIVKTRFIDDGADSIPILTAARTMHALVRRPQTVFSTATMLCYYRIVRELYLAVFPNWIIGAARAGEGGRVSAFVTSECVRAILVFQRAICDTATFFKTTKRLLLELDRLEAIPNVDEHLEDSSGSKPTRWEQSLDIEFERVVLDWYAANDLRHNVIALGLTRESTSQDSSPLPTLFPLSGATPIARADIETALRDLPKLLRDATEQAKTNIEGAQTLIRSFRDKEKETRKKWWIDETASSHNLASKIIDEAFDEAKNATSGIADYETHKNLPDLLERAHEQYLRIHHRIHRIIEPARRYVEGVLNRELAQAANSARFDAGELLFAAACFGALTNWKQNEQLAEARRLLIKQLPEDGRLQATQPFHSTSQGSRLIPIAFEMTRCFAQLLQRDFSVDLDPKVVRKILNAFEENPIGVSADKIERIGWNFRGAPESQKPSVWVTAIGVFALDRTIKMLNERINAMVLRHFNVEPRIEVDAAIGSPHSSGKLTLNDLIYPDYELQSLFRDSRKYAKHYEEDPSRVDCVSIGVRLQQMRAHLTRALLPVYYTKKSSEVEHHKTYSAILYGPPGTGKTTLAEALAATANVPLVRLSPSDLMVQGSDVLESRARAIFDSLAMLTEAVIFLDEFEPVVRTRRVGKGQKDLPPDPPEFKFLVTGMLPKLIKLNKVAEKQSVVYCLATNYLSQIDSAAKRVGRFDLQIPIYHPDPMSRIGVFLYRLITMLQQKERAGDNAVPWREKLAKLEADERFWTLTHRAIEQTAEVSAQSLATIFFSTKPTTKSLFHYILEDPKKDFEKPTPERSTHEQKSAVEEDIEAQRNAFEKSWAKRVYRAKKLSRAANLDAA